KIGTELVSISLQTPQLTTPAMTMRTICGHSAENRRRGVARAARGGHPPAAPPADDARDDDAHDLWPLCREPSPDSSSVGQYGHRASCGSSAGRGVGGDGGRRVVVGGPA